MIMDNILLVGSGKMGGALLEGLSKNLLDTASSKVIYPTMQIRVVDPNPSTVKPGIKVFPDLKDALSGFQPNIVIFAVKPQIIESLLPQFITLKDALFISIAAGKTLAFFEKHLGKDKAIIRSMPNLPALVGQGVTVLCANDNVSDNHKKRADALFKSVGETFWIDDESLLDAVTAISGSGPAYVFYFMESLIKAGIKLGLPQELATMLANSTVRGSAELAHSSDKTVQQLKEQVISPNGTTEAGLKILAASDGLEKLVEKTAVAARNRSRELAG
jgi:pyrroline-5-carboxylate reductase